MCVASSIHNNSYDNIILLTPLLNPCTHMHNVHTCAMRLRLGGYTPHSTQPYSTQIPRALLRSERFSGTLGLHSLLLWFPLTVCIPKSIVGLRRYLPSTTVGWVGRQIFRAKLSLLHCLALTLLGDGPRSQLLRTARALSITYSGILTY